jgi:glycosyltransferase involved in cell wall biosynthesis
LVEYLQAQGGKVEVISIPWRSYLAHLGDNYSSDIEKRLLHLQVDVLIQDELNHPSLFRLNQKIKPHVNFPIVAVVHHLRSKEAHLAWQRWVYRLVEKQYLESVDGFILVSKTTRKDVEALVGTNKPFVLANPPADRLRETLNFIEITERVKTSGRLKVVFLGSVTRRKDLITLLRALDGLPRGSWGLKVIGGLEVESAYVRKCLKLIARLDLDEHVEFTGELSQVELVQELKKQDVLVVPSTYEGFGMVYLEGMGFGLPAIGASAGAAKEIISDGQDGFLISPGNWGDLRNKLQLLGKDRNRLLNLSLNAKKRFDSHPAWQETAARIYQFLLSL